MLQGKADLLQARLLLLNRFTLFFNSLLQRYNGLILVITGSLQHFNGLTLDVNGLLQRRSDVLQLSREATSLFLDESAYIIL